MDGNSLWNEFIILGGLSQRWLCSSAPRPYPDYFLTIKPRADLGVLSEKLPHAGQFVTPFPMLACAFLPPPMRGVLRRANLLPDHVTYFLRLQST